MLRQAKLLLLAITATSTIAYAAKAKESEAVAIDKVNIPMTQAIAAAEQHINGKVIRAEFENSKVGWVYDLEVVGSGKVYEVRIDPREGRIISSAEAEAKSSHDHDEDEED